MRGVKEEKIIKYKDQNYRSMPGWSYSYLALYAIDRWKFYKRYILKEKEEEKDNDYMTMGNIVDVLLTDESNFDKYFIITSANKPSGQQLDFITELFKLKLLDKKGTKLFKDLSYEAYETVKEGNGGKLRDSYEKFIENFEKNGKDYYIELISSIDKTIITLEEASIAQELVKKYNNCKAFNFPDCEVLTKVPVYFEITDIPFKSEIDKIVVNHTTKKIYGRDIKVSSFIEDFFIAGFLKRRYTIQFGVYMFALENWKEQNGYSDYTVENFGFEVLDALNKSFPLLYICPSDYYELTWEGFYFGNKYYSGVIELIQEIQECIKLDVWKISLKNYKNNSTTYFPKLTSKIEKEKEWIN